ncbi:MAG TPA: crossover junction endodeoxyribonuclease RuvC [Gemmatimonadaceae bacterium]|nr:crossover junction endodeoxyribonuclease RuvC [Gemmatimonadaceae bacterium]
MIVLGIDPGTAITGYGVVCTDRGIGFAKSGAGAPRQNEIAPQGAARLVECGVIRTSPRAPLASRLHDIFEGVTELIERHQPDALAVEDVFFARNVRTTVVLGHARGVVLLAGARAGVTIHEYAPALIKKTVVGRGAATKEQVQFMVARLLRLKTAPQPADAADGVACALTCVMSAGTAMLRLRVAG